MLLGRFAAGVNRFEDNLFIGFLEGNNEDIAGDQNPHKALTWIFFRMGMFPNPQRSLFIEDFENILERYASRHFESLILGFIPINDLIT